MRRTIRDTLIGLVVSVVYVLAVGYLEVQADAVDSGVGLSWRLEPLSAGEPRLPALQLIAVFCASFLTLLFLYSWGRRGRSPAVARACALALVAMFVVAVILGEAPAPSFMQVYTHGLGGLVSTGATSTATVALCGCIAAVEMLTATSVLSRGERQEAMDDPSEG